MARDVYWKEDLKTNAINEVLYRIEVGESVRTILSDKRDSKKLPSRKTFFEWLKEDEALSNQYARACEVRAENIFEDILNIADNNTSDIITKDGEKRTNNDVIQRSRLMVDARKWYLSKLNPKKYGDKIETTIQGGDKPIQTIDYSKVSTEALKEIAEAEQKNEQNT